MKRVVKELGTRARALNRARFREEASEGLHRLIVSERRSKTWLAQRLGTSKSYVTKILEGSSPNFTLDTLADVFCALGRSVHITLGTNLDEMRLPLDEKMVATEANNPLMVSAKLAAPDSYKIANYLDIGAFAPPTHAVPITDQRASFIKAAAI